MRTALTFCIVFAALTGLYLLFGPAVDASQRVERQVAQSDVPVLLVFTAEWCSGCQQAKPEIERLRRQTKGRLQVHYVEHQKHPELFRKYGVRSMPTFLVLEDGREVFRDTSVPALIVFLKILLGLVL